MKRNALLMLLAATLAVGCGKQESPYRGTVPVTEKVLMGNWVFDSLSGPFSDSRLRFYMVDTAHAMTFLGGEYRWSLDGRVVKAVRDLESPTAHETVVMDIRRIDELVYGEEFPEDTVMTVKGYVAEHRITSIDTVWTFGGTLHKK